MHYQILNGMDKENRKHFLSPNFVVRYVVRIIDWFSCFNIIYVLYFFYYSLIWKIREGVFGYSFMCDG